MAVPLFHIFEYADRDRAFWAEHLEDFVPPRLIDAHVHVNREADRLRPRTEEMRRQIWVNEVFHSCDAPTAQRCNRTCYPGREVGMVAFGIPDYDFDLAAQNRYLQAECPPRGWHSLSLIPPQWSAPRVEAELDQPGVIGVKVYYSLIEDTPQTRDAHLEASIFEFLPHHVLEVCDDRHAWVMLHVPKAERLGHPDNLREIREIRRRYPNLILVIAHLGRSYTEPHAREGLLPLADDPGLYFDNSAVLNPASYRVAHQHIGVERILYGSDNPIFYMRGRRQYQGRRYINRTSHPFHFNQAREPAEVEATYTLYMYEALKAIKDVFGELGYGPREARMLFHENAAALIRRTLARKPAAAKMGGAP